MVVPLLMKEVHHYHATVYIISACLLFYVTPFPIFSLVRIDCFVCLFVFSFNFQLLYSESWLIWFWLKQITNMTRWVINSYLTSVYTIAPFKWCTLSSISRTVSLNGGWNRSTQRKLPNCRKSLTNFITWYNWNIVESSINILY